MTRKWSILAQITALRSAAHDAVRPKCCTFSPIWSNWVLKLLTARTTLPLMDAQCFTELRLIMMVRRYHLWAISVSVPVPGGGVPGPYDPLGKWCRSTRSLPIRVIQSTSWSYWDIVMGWVWLLRLISTFGTRFKGRTLPSDINIDWRKNGFRPNDQRHQGPMSPNFVNLCKRSITWSWQSLVIVDLDAIEYWA